MAVPAIAPCGSLTLTRTASAAMPGQVMVSRRHWLVGIEVAGPQSVDACDVTVPSGSGRDDDIGASGVIGAASTAPSLAASGAVAESSPHEARSNVTKSK